MEVYLINSSAVRRSSNIGWSFPKEQRFKSTKRNEEVDYINPFSSLSPRATSLGFGQRWKPEIQSSKGMPPPGSYEIPSTFSSKVGPKIVKSFISPLNSMRHLTPGPGTYENVGTVGKDSPKFSFRKKIEMPKPRDNPAPTAYNPKRTLTEFSGYSNIGFGIGNREFLQDIIKRQSPGPGTYTLGSEFDKCKKY
jgi:hypothetical protein